MSEESGRLYKAAQRRLREVTTLYEASQACLSISDQKGLLTAIIEAAARATDAALGSVMLIDKERGEYVFGAHYGLSQETITAVEAELHIPLGEGLTGTVVTTSRPVVVADVTTDPRWIPMETKEPIRCFLGVPLVGRDGRPLGALTLSHPEADAFDDDHARLLSTFANQAAMAIENARLYEQAQARSRYLETLQRINATLRSTLPLSQVLETIAQGAGKALNYIGSLILVPDATGERLTLGAVWGSRFLDAAIRLTGLEVGSFSLPLTANENPMARAYLRGELQAWSGEPERIVVDIEPPISPKLAPVIERVMGARLAVCVSLPVGEKVVGVLVVFSSREQLPDEERAMLLGLADQAGLAIENAQLYEQAQHEIAERQRAIRALRESEERYRRLVELSFDVIAIHRGGKIVYINAAGAELFGASSPEEVIGKTLLDFVHPDYLETAEARMLRTSKGTIAPLIEEKLIRLDETSVDAEVVEVPITYQGQPAVQVVARDITERKRGEEEIHSLSQFRERIIDNANVWLNVLDEKRNVLVWNKAAEEISGYSRDEVMGHGKIWEWLYPDEEYRNRITAKAAAIIEKGEVSEDFATTIRRKDGQTRIIAWNSRNLVDERGTPIGSIALGRDITERKQLEAQLRQAQKMEAIGTLAGGIAHDFNNILTGILGFASIIHSKLPVDSPLRSDVETIVRSAQRASELTRQLLTFARRGRVEVRPLSLNNMAREVINLLERTIDKAIAIELCLADDLATVEGNTGQLHQMLLNLCLNARNAMPQGGQLIIETQNVTLSEEKTHTELDLEAGQYALLSVTDTGIGMNAEIQQRLFEPFFTTKEQGRGLGLAMVYGIVRGHGGAIHVYSEPGQGSTFKVYLPVASRLAQDTAPEEVEALGGSETILVVEDEESVRALLRRILEEGGYTVLLAANGVEAVERYAERSTAIDLVVLDIIMPQMGGRETYERLREIDPEVRVLLSSGYSENGQAQDILATGARGFLQKPYDLRAVLRNVREVLES